MSVSSTCDVGGGQGWRRDLRMGLFPAQTEYLSLFGLEMMRLAIGGRFLGRCFLFSLIWEDFDIQI